MFNIVLHEPEKPDNTGNIGRTCVATGSALHLIYPIGFQLTRKNIHHAGLDYWERLKLFKHDSYEDFVRFAAHTVRGDAVGASSASPSGDVVVDKNAAYTVRGDVVGASSASPSGDVVVDENAAHTVRGDVVVASSASPSKSQIWYATTKAHKSYTEVEYHDGDYIVFGKESAGIPEEILSQDEDHCIRIPMIENERSLNLSNSVAIVLYEALRQNGFNGMLKKGELHRLNYTK